MDFTSMNNDELSKALSEKREAATALFALTEPTIEQVNEAEALVASIRDIEGEQSARAEAVKDAADRFAAAKTAFASDEEPDPKDEADSEDAPDDEEEKFSAEDESDEDESDEGESDEGEAGEAEAEAESGETVAARTNHTTSQKVPVKAQSTAKRVAKRTKRPEVQAQAPVTITASHDVPEFSTGQQLDSMEQVTRALMNRVKGFAPYNAQAAKAAYAQSGGQEVLHKFGVATFGVDIPEALTASQGNDYTAVRNAIKAREGDGATLTAAGWCAPSTPVYTWLADYVIDGLVTVPEVGAPRGGLLLTTGPARDRDVDNFGFIQTEAQAIAKTVKPSETIVCPDFEDQRLDAIGYTYKIPILTQKAYPELVTDALRYASVLYAHKVNKRIIGDIVALASTGTAAPYGATFTDTLEALSIVATKKRHWWSVGDNAVMEVKLPWIAREVFRADMSRRTGLALSDVATDQRIEAEFAARRLAVEYVSDWQDQSGHNGVFPATFDALIYPSGAVIKAVEDVINLSAVYDAASLSVNEYTGVFFEQGILVAKAGYDITKMTIPVCTAGATGAASFTCDGSI